MAAGNPSLSQELFDVARPFSLEADSATVTTPALVTLGRLDFMVPPTSWNGVRSVFSKPDDPGDRKGWAQPAAGDG